MGRDRGEETPIFKKKYLVKPGGGVSKDLWWKWGCGNKTELTFIGNIHQADGLFFTVREEGREYAQAQKRMNHMKVIL